MPQDLIKFASRPNDWGIVKMMERIEKIERRFGSNMFPQVQKGDFQAELKNSLDGAGGAEAAREVKKEEELFAPGTFRNNAPQDTRFDPLISQVSKKYDLEEDLLKAVIKTESGFNPGAVSPKGAMGLMQLMPNTAKSLNVNNPFDPEQNIDGGARYLRAMLDRFGGDKSLALSAYNAGPKAVETYKGVPPYRETRDYVNRILSMLNEG